MLETKVGKSEKFVKSLLTDLETFTSEAKKSRFDKVMKLFGILGWSVSYIAIISAGHHAKVSVLHGPLIAYNLVWEFCKTFVWAEGDLELRMFVGVFWLFFDFEITRILFLYGDGNGNWNLEMARFAIAIIGFALLSYQFTKLGKHFCRLWRHTSEWISLLIQASILYISQTHQVQYHRTISWSMMFGNLCYLYSVRRQYKGWSNPLQHPIRSTMVFTCFIPGILFNLAYILIAHELTIMPEGEKGISTLL